jgi:hypothetical protein
MVGFVTAYLAGALLVYPEVAYRRLDLSSNAIAGGSIVLLFLSIGVMIAGLVKYGSARAKFLEANERRAIGEADEALGQVAGPDDLLGLIRANAKQIQAYDALARAQAQTSFRASQVAMGVGLVLLATGVATAILADSSATKYSAAIVTATGAAVGGYLSRTYLIVQRAAGKQMNFYFQQPLIQSYLLSAERLIAMVPEPRKAHSYDRLVEACLSQLPTTPAPQALGNANNPSDEETKLAGTPDD